MQKHKVYPPLQLVREMDSAYPGIFNRYERALKEKTFNQTEFDIAAKIASFYFPTDQESADYCAMLLDAVGSWRKAKQVYTFSEELINMLYNTEDFIVPTDLFRCLPYRAFYLESPNIKGISGIIVKYLRDDVNNHLIFIVLRNDASHAYLTFPLDKAVNFFEMVEEYAKNFQDVKIREELRKCLVFGLQAAMYLCVRNCDIVENPKQQKIYTPSSTVKDKYSEVRKWDVGYRITREINPSAHSKSNSATVSDSSSHRQKNRPREHWRKAHWHTYWVGKGRTQKELRFIQEIHVNDIQDVLPIVEHQK